MFKVTLPGQSKAHLTATPQHDRVKKTLCGKTTFYRFPPSEWTGSRTNLCLQCQRSFDAR